MTVESLEQLAPLKSLFMKQLSKMAKSYITRYVYDPNHTTLTICKGKTPIGGVCFRAFKKFKILEIVFLAVSSNEQVKSNMNFVSVGFK